MRPPRTATSACRAATSFRSCASAAPKSGQPSTSRSRLASTRKSAVRGMSLGLASDERHRPSYLPRGSPFGAPDRGRDRRRAAPAICPPSPKATRARFGPTRADRSAAFGCPRNDTQRVVAFSAGGDGGIRYYFRPSVTLAEELVEWRRRRALHGELLPPAS